MATPARKRTTRLAPPRRAISPKRADKQPRAASRRSQKAFPPATPAALVHELGSCVTEADIVQVLYRGLEPLFGYDVVVIQILEREAWYHSLAIDSGVLQDIRRRPLATSVFAHMYTRPEITLVPNEDPSAEEQAKGPGAGMSPRLVIWVPVIHRGEVIGSAIYQSYRRRRVPASEMAFLEEVHRRLGV